MNIVDVIAKQARFFPEEPAFVEVRPVSGVRREISWKLFHERVNRLANALLPLGAGKGEKVFLLGKNSLNWLEAYFGILATGAWAAPLNFRFTDDDIRFCAKTAEPAIFIFDEEYGDRIQKLREELPTVNSYIVIGGKGAASAGVVTMEELIEKGSPGAPNIELEDEDEGALYFTSGTTGAPKPVLIQHKNIMCAAVTEAMNHNLTQSDRFLMMPPMYHVAITHMFGVMAGGRMQRPPHRAGNPPDNGGHHRKGAHIGGIPARAWAMDILEAFDKAADKDGGVRFEPVAPDAHGGPAHPAGPGKAAQGLFPATWNMTLTTD